LTESFRNIPKVDELVRDVGFAEARGVSKAKLAGLVREELELLRGGMAQGKYTGAGREALYETVVERVCRKLEALRADRLRKVVNATGVVMHTNLGRSVLGARAAEKVQEIATGYSNLEYSTETGARRYRLSYVEQLITDITGAEAALVVNNNAAAVLLTLNTLAKDRRIILSRGEMVEIGDGFRIGDIITTAGCGICEVGSTNRTTPADYRQAVTPDTAALVKIHTSNYRIVGYTEDVGTAQLAGIAREYDVPLVEDMGSGILADISRFGFAYERTPMDAIADGADIVTFSGDKCLGGPQAGIIAGRRELVAKMRRNQLTRCMRIDKLCLAALEATLEDFAEGWSAPTMDCISADPEAARAKAHKLRGMLEDAMGERFALSVMPHEAQFGGGAMPLAAINSYGLYVTSGRFSAARIEAALRGSAPPVAATVKDGRVILDMLTVDEADLRHIVQAFRTCVQ